MRMIEFAQTCGSIHKGKWHPFADSVVPASGGRCKAVHQNIWSPHGIYHLSLRSLLTAYPPKELKDFHVQATLACPASLYEQGSHRTILAVAQLHTYSQQGKPALNGKAVVAEVSTLV